MTKYVGTAGDDIFSGGAGRDAANGYAGDDALDGMGGGDRLYGGAGADTLTGGLDDGAGDLLDGGGGDDLITAESGDTILGGVGIDTVSITFDAEAAVTGDLRPLDSGGVVVFSDGTTVSGVETGSLTFGAGADQIILPDEVSEKAPGGFAVQGGDGDDTLVGGALNDALYGEGGNDVLSGGAGTDYLGGGEGADLLSGGHGDDQFDGGGGDTIKGGAGVDTFSISLALEGGGRLGKPVYVDMAQVESGAARIGAGITLSQVEIGSFLLGGGDDVVLGANYAVYAAGGGGNDKLTGGAGGDTFNGEAGDDTISGGAGNDTLVAGQAGDDVLRGGVGADTYLFAMALEAPDAMPTAEIRGLQILDVIDLSGFRGGAEQVTFVEAFAGEAGQAVLTYDADDNRTSIAVDADGDDAADLVITIDGDQTGFDNYVL
jgi:Ca2+-binding RTX toxin-like protein